MSHHTLLRSGTRLSMLTMASRILGLVREMTKASFLGTTALSDAFSVAFVIPNLLRRLFAENSISVAFIPTFSGYIEKNDRTEVREFLSATFTMITLAASLTVMAGIIATPVLVRLFGTETGETVFLTRIMFPYLAIISVAAFFQGILNSVKVFSPSGFTPILFNIIVIGSTWLFSPLTANPARAMAIGVIAGGSVQALFQLPYVLKTGYRFSFVSLQKTLSNPGTRTVLRLIGPTVIGMAAYQLNDIVSMSLAARSGEGIVSSLQYSLRLQELILGVFAVSIGTVILPDLSTCAARSRWNDFSRILRRAIETIALITIPVTFFSLVTGKELISLLFKNNAFTDQSVALTLQAFRWHTAALFFIAVNRIISPAFYAQSDSSSPAKAGLASFAVNIILAIMLVSPMRGGGIALALSLASLANTVFLVLFLSRNAHINVRAILGSAIPYALRMIVFSLVAVAPLVLFRGNLYAAFAGRGKLVSLAIPLCLELAAFAIVGLLMLIVSRDEGLAALHERFSSRRKKAGSGD